MCSRKLRHQMYASQVRPPQLFCSEYAGSGRGIVERVVAPLAATAANVQVNRAARSRVPMTSSPVEIMVCKFSRPGIECD